MATSNQKQIDKLDQNWFRDNPERTCRVRYTVGPEKYYAKNGEELQFAAVKKLDNANIIRRGASAITPSDKNDKPDITKVMMPVDCNDVVSLLFWTITEDYYDTTANVPQEVGAAMARELAQEYERQQADKFRFHIR